MQALIQAWESFSQRIIYYFLTLLHTETGHGTNDKAIRLLGARTWQPPKIRYIRVP